MKSEMNLVVDARSENESLVRICIATFLTRMHPTLEELEDVKTAVSEAVTNAIIHGAPQDGKVYIDCSQQHRVFHIEITDHGTGIEDVKKAMEPLYTTRPELERSGMGFAFMEAFMNVLEVDSEVGRGTRVMMEKIITGGRDEE